MCAAKRWLLRVATGRAYLTALGGALAGNMFTTKAVVEMMKCVATPDADADPCATPCSFNPFLTIWPYLFVTVSLTLACVSLYMLAVGLRHFEALTSPEARRRAGTGPAG